MNITIENKKQKAIELMQKLDIYKPYIIRFNTSYSIVRLLTPNSFARFSLVSCRRRHKTSSMACRLSAAVISAVHLLFSNFLPAFYKSNSQVLCDFEKII